MQFGHFILEPRHYHEGLTDTDMETYSGLRVVVTSLADFPNWNDMSVGEKLPPEKLYERQQALRQFVAGHGGRLESTDALKIAKYRTDYCIKLMHPRECSSWTARADENSRLLLAGQASWVYYGSRAVAVPDSILNDEDVDIAVPHWAVMFFDRGERLPVDRWASWTKLPGCRMTHVPDVKAQRLYMELHEAAHLCQAEPTKDMPSAQRSLWTRKAEAGADLTARAAIRDYASILKEIDADDFLRAHLAWRYARGMTMRPPHHIVGLSVEGFESGHADFHGDAVLNNIRMKILEKREPGLYEQWTMPDSDKQDEIRDMMLRKPGSGYSFLRRCLDDGDFDAAPSERRVAERILQSVEYFCEGLTRNPDIVRKIHPAARPPR